MRALDEIDATAHTPPALPVTPSVPLRGLASPRSGRVGGLASPGSGRLGQGVRLASEPLISEAGASPPARD